MGWCQSLDRLSPIDQVPASPTVPATLIAKAALMRRKHIAISVEFRISEFPPEASALLDEESPAKQTDTGHGAAHAGGLFRLAPLEYGQKMQSCFFRLQLLLRRAVRHCIAGQSAEHQGHTHAAWSCGTLAAWNRDIPAAQPPETRLSWQ